MIDCNLLVCDVEILLLYLFKILVGSNSKRWVSRVEASITGQSREFVQNLEKYKSVLKFPMKVDRNEEGGELFGTFIS